VSKGASPDAFGRGVARGFGGGGRESGARVARALDSLDPKSRLVLTLLFVEGLTEEETAAALEHPIESVRALAEEALVRLFSRGAALRRAA
jgi:DNA-directed RNA polymerase specialized sigma24 family protein